jgi:hypothetical protein
MNGKSVFEYEVLEFRINIKDVDCIMSLKSFKLIH